MNYSQEAIDYIKGYGNYPVGETSDGFPLFAEPDKDLLIVLNNYTENEAINLYKKGWRYVDFLELILASNKANVLINEMLKDGHITTKKIWESIDSVNRGTTESVLLDILLQDNANKVFLMKNLNRLYSIINGNVITIDDLRRRDPLLNLVIEMQEDERNRKRKFTF